VIHRSQQLWEVNKVITNHWTILTTGLDWNGLESKYLILHSEICNYRISFLGMAA